MLLENLACIDFLSLTMENLYEKKRKTDAKMKKIYIVRGHSRDSASFQTRRNTKFRNINGNFHSKSAEGYSPIEANVGYG